MNKTILSIFWLFVVLVIAVSLHDKLGKGGWEIRPCGQKGFLENLQCSDSACALNQPGWISGIAPTSERTWVKSQAMIKHKSL